MADITVELIDHMGTDLSVVDAARVSFAKKSEWEWDYSTWRGKDYIDKVLSDKDAKLIGYLADHNHWSPFAHAFASFRIKAPIFVARQLVKHQVGLAWNEESRRYIDDAPEYYRPAQWRGKPEGSIKQGSEGTVNQVLRSRMHGDQTIDDAVERLIYHAEELYIEMLEHGVAPEQARMVLPLNTMTNWIWSGSLYAFARVCRLRLDPHAQAETRLVAEGIDREMAKLFPVSWKELMKDG